MAGRAGRRRLIARLPSATSSSPFCSLAYEIISKNRLDRPPSLALRHETHRPAACAVTWSAAEILDDFRRRLEAIVVLLRPDRRLADLDRPSGQRGGI